MGLPILKNASGHQLTPLLEPLQVPLLLPQVVGEHLGYGLHGAPDGVPSAALGADEQPGVHLDEVQEPVEGVHVLDVILQEALLALVRDLFEAGDGVDGDGQQPLRVVGARRVLDVPDRRGADGPIHELLGEVLVVLLEVLRGDPRLRGDLLNLLLGGLPAEEAGLEGVVLVDGAGEDVEQPGLHVDLEGV